jgi:hypothetical protein
MDEGNSSKTITEVEILQKVTLQIDPHGRHSSTLSPLDVRMEANMFLYLKALKARGKKICARRLVLHKQNSNIYLKNSIRYVRKEKEANVQNINSILSDLS